MIFQGGLDPCGSAHGDVWFSLPERLNKIRRLWTLTLLSPHVGTGILCINGLWNFRLAGSVIMTGDIADPFPR